MALVSKLMVVAFLVIIPVTFALPSPEPGLAERQTPNCLNTNPETFYSASCWATLDLTNWLNNWNAPSICTDADAGVNCCGANEEWSTCFLRLGKGDSGLNCSQISVNTNDCAYNAALAPDLDPKIAPQVRYILRTIFNINAFFNDWYTSLQYATTQTALTIDPIVTAVDPVSSMPLPFNEVLSALIAGLPFIGSPLFATAIDASTAAKALVTGLQQAPGLVKSLWPAGSAESQIIQIGTLSTQLKNANEQIGQRIDAGLWTLMSDKATFAAFASSGAFSGDPQLSIPQQVTQISQGLQLYILTTAMVGNKYTSQILPTASIVPDALPDFCQYHGSTICYQNASMFGGVTYILEKTDADDGIHSAQMMQKIAQGGWATPEQIFQWSFDCAASGQFGQNVIGLDANGGFDVSCLAQLTECYSGTGCSINGKCPVQNCPKP